MSKSKSELEEKETTPELLSDDSGSVEISETVKSEIKTKAIKQPDNPDVMLLGVQTTASKMTVTVYLRKRKLDKYVESILKKQYKSEVHTEAEWDAIVESILGHKL